MLNEDATEFHLLDFWNILPVSVYTNLERVYKQIHIRSHGHKKHTLICVCKHTQLSACTSAYICRVVSRYNVMIKMKFDKIQIPVS